MGLTISVVVPVYNGGAQFRKCLDALAASTLKPLELIVVDDGSADNSAQLAVSYGAKVFHTDRRASGPAKARNVGAAQASGDVLFFTDADCAVNPDALQRVAAIFDRPDAPNAAIGSYDFNPGAPNFLSQYKNLFHAYVHQISSTEASTFWGGCGAIRRADFMALGGFDAERYARPSVEDIDLGYRLKSRGGRIVLDKALQVTHLKRWTAKTLLRTDIFDRGIVWTRLLLRYGEFKADLNLQTHNRVSVVLIYVLLLSLLAALVTPWALAVSLVTAGLLFALNIHLYQYFAAQRGSWFTLRCILWHWLYYFYNGLSFGVGTAYHLFDVLSGRYEPLPKWSVEERFDHS